MSRKNRKFKPYVSKTQMHKVIVPIRGIHCRSCEILIEDELRKIEGVRNIEVSYKQKQAVIHSNYSLSLELITAAVNSAGYEVGQDESKSFITKDPTEYKELCISLIVLIVLYLIVLKTGILGKVSFGSGSNPSGYIPIFIIGLTAGISTCMALVGGLVLGISARHSEKHPETSTLQKFRPHLYFNIGRVSSYFLLGGVIGLAGKAFRLSGFSLGVLTIIVGIVMLILGLQLTQIFPRLSSGGLTLPSGISRLLGIRKHHEKEYSHTNSMLTGALTFFLPCGFTQAMQLYAMSTGNFWSGALIMGFFALGTVPGLLSIGGLTSVMKGAFAKKFFKFAGLLVIFLAFFNLSNGFNLIGFSGLFSRSATKTETAKNIDVDDPNVKIENGIQIVRMEQVGAGYRPNQFTIKQNIPTKWIITSKSQSCAASIYSKQLGIQRNLNPGENIIEFTPKDAGEIKFSCAMGMYTGKFIVAENNLAGPPSQELEPTAKSQSDNKAPDQKANESETQVLKATYTLNEDIVPKKFSVKAGKPVRLEIDVKEDGQGCMSSIVIPRLADDFQYLEKGTLVMNFIPKEKGIYFITCAMGSKRGVIEVN